MICAIFPTVCPVIIKAEFFERGQIYKQSFVTLSSFEDYGHLITATLVIGSENQAFISSLFYIPVHGPSLKRQAVNSI
jgi:hypothetical protein